VSYSMRGMRGGWVAIATCDGSGCTERMERAGGTEAEAAVSSDGMTWAEVRA